MSRLERLINSVVRRGVVVATQALKMQGVSVQFQVDHDAAEVEHFEPYGFTSRVSADGKAEAITLNVSGTDQTLCIMVSDRRYRLTSLDSGDVALYDDRDQSVVLGSSGITVNAVGDCEVNATGNVTVDGAKVLLGGATGVALEKVLTGSAGLEVPATNVYAGNV